jgi:hypothetical protein
MSITYYCDLKYFHALARPLCERSETPARRAALALAVDLAIETAQRSSTTNDDASLKSNVMLEVEVKRCVDAMVQV